MDKKLLTITFRNVLLASLYIFGVSQLMQNGEKLFGKDDNFLAPFAILLLFSLSAAVVGGLVFGQTVMLFFEGKKAESIKSAIYSVGWLAVFTVFTLVLLVLFK